MIVSLDMRARLGLGYKSRLQVARVVSEDWAVRNLYCPACTSDTLQQTPTNTRAIDLLCPECSQGFQVKSSLVWNQKKIVDAAYAPMIAAVRSDNVPNLFVVQYTDSWEVRNVLLIPYFFFTTRVIEQRKPLSPTARRAGWVGCNILVSEIPRDGKLRLVADGVIANAKEVRKRFQHVRPLSELRVDKRGWTIDVLKAVREMNRREFMLSEIYSFEPALSVTYPKNRNVRPKIRQQLQKLRDIGFLDFVSPGHYRVREND